MKGTRNVLASVVLVTLAAVVAHGDEAADRCGGSKEKAAGRYAQTLLACNATATAADTSVSASCTAAAASKLDAAFARAEEPGGCATGMDAGGTRTAIASDVDALLAALAPDPTDASRKCAATKLKSSGKYFAGVLACYAKGAKRSEGPDPDCLLRASSRIARIFASADGRGGCASTGDVAAIGDLVEDAARSRVASLSPVCGDAVVGPGNDCEPTNDVACPSLCSGACICITPPDCGDGVAQLPEECDDGAQAGGDGCSSTCQLEDASALCAGIATDTGTEIDAVLVSSAFASPIYAISPPLDPSRLFVVERAGRIRILNLLDDSIRTTAFLDIVDLVNTDGEGGLLSMAFDPAYDTNRRFFLNYTNTSGDTTIARYETSAVDPNVADESTARILLTIDQPFFNHDGGQIAFGPDGYLYVGMGDGGGGGDPLETGQNDNSLLGKMLRMDVDVTSSPYYAVPPTNPHYVDGSNPLELIWAKGLRNPWRFSFDRATGDLVIGDVGQGSREEIDFQSAASTGGENYGWDIFEGTTCHEPAPDPVCPSPPTGFTFPVLEYSHASGCSITGGFVYRGCAMPDLAGSYFYSDYCGAFLRTIEFSGGAAINPQNRTSDAESAGANISTVISFGQDARGELYILQQGGSMYRIVAD